MERVVLWSDLLAPYMPEGKRGRPPFAVKGMLRIDLMQQWLTLSDPAMEEALHDVQLFREFAGAQGWDERLPDESTIPRFRHVLKKHMVAPQILQAINDQVMHRGLLKSCTVVGAILITASSSTKNAAGERAPEMKQSSKGQHLYFGMKCHIAWMLSLGWFTPCAARSPTSTVWSKPTVCCIGKTGTCLPMPASRGLASGLMPRRV
jgi:transposase, IS5 family